MIRRAWLDVRASLGWNRGTARALFAWVSALALLWLFQPPIRGLAELTALTIAVALPGALMLLGALVVQGTRAPLRDERAARTELRHMYEEVCRERDAAQKRVLMLERQLQLKQVLGLLAADFKGLHELAKRPVRSHEDKAAFLRDFEELKQQTTDHISLHSATKAEHFFAPALFRAGVQYPDSFDDVHNTSRLQLEEYKERLRRLMNEWSGIDAARRSGTLVGGIPS